VGGGGRYALMLLGVGELGNSRRREGKSFLMGVLGIASACVPF
jgi:hypothetical protein